MNATDLMIRDYIQVKDKPDDGKKATAMRSYKRIMNCK